LVDRVFKLRILFIKVDSLLFQSLEKQHPRPTLVDNLGKITEDLFGVFDSPLRQVMAIFFQVFYPLLHAFACVVESLPSPE